MATYTLVTAGSTTTNTVNPYSTASVTLASGKLILVSVSLDIASADITLTGHSITWTRLTNFLASNVNDGYHALFWGIGTGATGTLEIDSAAGGTNQGAIWHVVEVDGADTSTPIVGTAYTNTGSSTTAALASAMSAWGAGNSAFYSVLFNANFVSGDATPVSPFTEISEDGHGNPARSMMSAASNTEDTTPEAAFTQSRIWGMVVVEIKAAGGGATTHQVTATGSNTQTGSGALRLLAVVAGTGSNAQTGSGSLILVAQVSGTGSNTQTGSASLILVARLQAIGTNAQSGSANLTIESASGTHQITATGQNAQTGSGALTGGDSLSAQGSNAQSGSGALRLFATVSAEGLNQQAGQAALIQLLQLAATGDNAQTGSVDITIVGPVTYEPVPRRSTTAVPRRSTTAVARRG